MANAVEVQTPGAKGSPINAAFLRRTDQYGTSALARVQWSATINGTYADISGTATITLQDDTEIYWIGDPNGTDSMYYRSRFENAGGTRVSTWTPATATRYE